jgi:hypothetical protein
VHGRSSRVPTACERCRPRRSQRVILGKLQLSLMSVLRTARQGRCRAILAAPIDGRLLFVGEACSRSHYSTAHGGCLTGIAARQAIAARRCALDS